VATRGAGQLTAAAQRYTTKIATSRARKPDASWQNEAWRFFDSVPEVRFAATWVGNAMSGATIYAGRRASDGTIERAPDDHPASEIAQQIAGGPDGQSTLLGDFGPHLVVAGEGWIVVRPTVDIATRAVSGYDWRVLSTSEVQQQNGKMTAEIDGDVIELPAYDEISPDESAPVAIRVWDPHPNRHIEADSPVRSSLALLEELQLLNAAVAAIARSRLTGRGVLLVPKGTRFPTAPGAAGDAEDDVIDVFMEVASTAIREPESAAATVPIVLEVPAEAIGAIKHLTFESDFDDLAIRLREEAIRRFANGLEVPAEILLGLADSNHWSAWLATAEAIRMGVEPRLGIVCHALTTQWLRPMLEAQDVDDADEWLIWYDTSSLRAASNRATTALEAFKLNLISAAAARRETGFDEGDAPDAPQPDDAGNGEATDDEDGTVTTLPVNETQEIPDTLPASASPLTPVADPRWAAVLEAVDGVIHNAMCAVGEKIRTKPVCPRSERARARTIRPSEMHTVYPVEAHQVDEWHMLDTAWDRIPEIAARYGLDADCLINTLDEYARDLIAARHPHTYKSTDGLLRTSCLVAAA